MRHDLGLYESVILFALFGLFLVLDRNKDRFHGFFSGLLLVVYGPTRFVLDSLRATDLSKSDPRYRPWDVVRATREWMAEGGESAVELTRSLSETRLAEGQWVGFTFAQYGALALTALGIWIFAIRAGKGHMDISGELARDYKGGKVPERATEEVEPTEPEEVEPTEPGEVESPSS